jgi:hypothetical protein
MENVNHQYYPLNGYYIKLVILYIIGYFLASHYRPLQNNLGFFDFGLADSGVSTISFISIYLILTPPRIKKSKAIENAISILFIYIGQEIFCFFFPSLIGTFDVKDIVYCLFGCFYIYHCDILKRHIL